MGFAFGTWSALNTSPIGTEKFSGEHVRTARLSVDSAFVIVEGIAGGIYLVYRDKFAAGATALTGLGLWLAYHHLIEKSVGIVDGNGSKPPALVDAPKELPLTCWDVPGDPLTPVGYNLSLVGGR